MAQPLATPEEGPGCKGEPDKVLESSSGSTNYSNGKKVCKGICSCLLYFIFFLVVFVCLFLTGIIKSAVFSPLVFLVIAFGDTGVVLGLWPLHLVWSIYCLIKTKKFGPRMKCLLIVLVPFPIALWTVIGVAGSAVMGVVYAFVWPVMETFKCISKRGPVGTKLLICFTAGTWSCVLGACTIVRDFADFSFHTFFSVMDGFLESKEDEEPIELKVSQLPGCILAVVVGILLDVPVISLIALCKAPILLIKGWQRLVQDLVGREGPFLETVCVPFAGLWILLWPLVVILAILAGIVSSFGFGCYAAVVAYQEDSTKKGLLYVIAAASIFDEYTNDLLYLQEGSCFPRPLYRKQVSPTRSLGPSSGQQEHLQASPASAQSIYKHNESTTVVMWESFFGAFEDTGKELLRNGAIGIADLDAWQNSRSKVVNIGIPAYAFLECFIYSIKHGFHGFLLRGNIEITHLNRPEGRVFDWLYEPMSIIKEQIRSLNLQESEELYFYKHCLYGGDAERMNAWENGGIPPPDNIKRAQLEGISRRLQGFCLTLSRLPTSRRRFSEIVKAIEQEARSSCTHETTADLEAGRSGCVSITDTPDTIGLELVHTTTSK